ncbi:MAG TPA: hypothetical protein VF103_19195 [Polyangiaceae bacterium]
MIRGRGPWLVGLIVLAAHETARADHCSAPERLGASTVRASLRGEAGHFDTTTDDGTFIGVVPGLSLGAGPARLRAELGVYRLSAPAGVEAGPGDLTTKLEETFFTPGRFAFGASLGASFPTGDAEKRLGMGHSMAGPSVFSTYESPRWFLALELGYASSLSMHDEPDVEAHHHHGGAEPHEHLHVPPIPNPMTAEELSLALGSSYELADWLRVSAAALGALSVIRGTEPPFRATLEAGVELPFGPVTATAGAKLDPLGATRRQLGVVGAAFDF